MIASAFSGVNFNQFPSIHRSISLIVTFIFDLNYSIHSSAVTTVKSSAYSTSLHLPAFQVPELPSFHQVVLYYRHLFHTPVPLAPQYILYRVDHGPTLSKIKLPSRQQSPSFLAVSSYAKLLPSTLITQIELVIDKFCRSAFTGLGIRPSSVPSIPEETDYKG